MAATTALAPSIGPIEPEILYPLDDLKARSGLGSSALRAARKAGLRVRYAHGRAYIKGADFIEYIEREGSDTK